MTSEKFLDALKRSGIPEGSKDMRDYEEAKSYARMVSDGNYEDLIQVCAEYVGV